jgi:hypothetical protein
MFVAIMSLVVVSGILVILVGFGGIQILDDNYTAYAEIVEAPSFSVDSGFYDEPFYLEINVPEGTRVYYTLDCSDPNSNAIEYNEPIYLNNASLHDNVYSMRTDVSAGFYEDLINDNEGGSIPSYMQPDYLVDKCNVVRAIAVDDIGNVSNVVTGSFFVCNAIENYDGCNIISIVTDPDNLFAYESGIYVTGRIFDEYIDNINANYYGKDWRSWNANYRQHGVEWEKEAHFDFFSINGGGVY